MPRASQPITKCPTCHRTGRFKLDRCNECRKAEMARTRRAGGRKKCPTLGCVYYLGLRNNGGLCQKCARKRLFRPGEEQAAEILTEAWFMRADVTDDVIEREIVAARISVHRKNLAERCDPSFDPHCERAVLESLEKRLLELMRRTHEER